MKKIIIFLVLAVIFTGCVAVYMKYPRILWNTMGGLYTKYTTNLEMHLSLVENEESLDANSVTGQITIRDHMVTIKKTYGGYNPTGENMDYTTIFRLKPEEEKEIIDLITANNLITTIVEKPSHVSSTAVAVYSVSALFEAKSNKNVSHIEIAGITNVHPNNAAKLIQNSQALEAIKTVSNYIEMSAKK